MLHSIKMKYYYLMVMHYLNQAKKFEKGGDLEIWKEKMKKGDYWLRKMIDEAKTTC